MDLRPDETVIYFGHPSWRSLKAFYLAGALIALVAGSLVWLIFSPFTGIVVFAAILGATILVGLVRRIFVKYTITSDRLVLERGFLSREIHQTRIDRVQNVNTSQSPVDRLFRVGRVDFDTAGSDGADLSFEGVDDPPQVAAAVDEAQRLHAERLVRPADGTGAQ
ncbi:MAG: PH domain-containing protein [Acidobacteria bacterium]|nr:PH domain-containing protein [Acidobacteriota bacterium]